MIAVIKGAGDIASGIALRLYRAKFKIIMTDLPYPTAIRRTVSFSQAIINGNMVVEGVEAVYAKNTEQALKIVSENKIAVLADEKAECIKSLKPDFVIDAILAKKNLNTKITDAPVVIGVGPGFEAEKDCHAVVETKRGHYLGRVIYKGKPAENTGVPGNIGGYTIERIIRAPREGVFKQLSQIGDYVNENQVVAYVEDEPVKASISGVLRGILPSGTTVFKGMKSGDVDPRCKLDHCYCASDKALGIGGGVLEACLHFYKG